MHVLHLLIAATYIVAPVAGVWHAAAVRVRRGGSVPLRRARLAVLGGTAVGVLGSVAHAVGEPGRLVLGQVLLASYFAVGMILLLQWADAGLVAAARGMFGLNRPSRSRGRFLARAAGASLVRTAVVFAVGVPYVLAAVLTYRPRVRSIDTPASTLNWAFDPVRFPAATDATPIAGWWIPAAGGAADRTVLLCPGAFGDLAAHLPLVRSLRPDGWNVLAIDFRGHGDSGGQLCSFGDLERRDVLGAVRWLHGAHPDACRRVVGLGVNSGGAALIAAAADPSPDGQHIDAIAVYGCYDTLPNELAAVVRPYLPTPLDACLRRVGLPLAAAQVGADLVHFAPAELAKQLWPRPVLVIHAVNDPFVPFEQGAAVFDAALEPKSDVWIDGRGDYEKVMRNAAVTAAIRRHFDHARSVI